MTDLGRKETAGFFPSSGGEKAKARSVTVYDRITVDPTEFPELAKMTSGKTCVVLMKVAKTGDNISSYPPKERTITLEIRAMEEYDEDKEEIREKEGATRNDVQEKYY